METWITILSSGLGVGILTAAVTWYSARGTNRNKAEEVAAEKARTQLAGNIELNKYIDERIERASQPMREQIKQLREEMGRLTSRERDRTSVIRRFFQRLVWWDERGRPGPMPMPSEEDMHVLDLSDIEITAPTAEVAALRTPYVPPIPGKETP